MAKLNGVKVIDMVGGKVTKVEYEGSMYTNFGAVEAEAGDLVMFHNSQHKTDAGEFYSVLSGDRYLANGGDGRYYTEGWGGKGRRDVYRREEFLEIGRGEAGVGDFVKFRKDRRDYIIAGKMYEIYEIDGAGDPQIIDEEGDSFDTCGEDVTFYTKASKDEEVDEIDTKDTTKVGDGRLSLGEYAKVVKNIGGHYASIGDIVKIVEDEEDYQPFLCESEDGRNAGYFHEDELVRVTEEERKEAEEVSKWAKIGRKPNEYKVGDIARITDYQCGHYEGTLVEVKGFGTTNLQVNGIYAGKLRDFYADDHCIELVVPAEARV